MPKQRAVACPSGWNRGRTERQISGCIRALMTDPVFRTVEVPPHACPFHFCLTRDAPYINTAVEGKRGTLNVMVRNRSPEMLRAISYSSYLLECRQCVSDGRDIDTADGERTSKVAFDNPIRIGRPRWETTKRWPLGSRCEGIPACPGATGIHFTRMWDRGRISSRTSASSGQVITQLPQP